MLTEAQVRAMSEEAKVAAILDLQQQFAALTVRLTELEARLNKNAGGLWGLRRAIRRLESTRLAVCGWTIEASSPRS